MGGQQKAAARAGNGARGCTLSSKGGMRRLCLGPACPPLAARLCAPARRAGCCMACAPRFWPSLRSPLSRPTLPACSTALGSGALAIACFLIALPAWLAAHIFAPACMYVCPLRALACKVPPPLPCCVALQDARGGGGRGECRPDRQHPSQSAEQQPVSLRCAAPRRAAQQRHSACLVSAYGSAQLPLAPRGTQLDQVPTCR